MNEKEDENMPNKVQDPIKPTEKPQTIKSIYDKINARNGEALERLSKN
ncbi:hypothetical protein [Gottfriedia acidiceleris]|nr:hypothetical protein [Gottfriedia acidiceleris]